MERYEGFLLSMSLHGIQVDPKFCYTGNLSFLSYRETITNFLDHQEEMPDAFGCANDHAATILLKYFETHGYSVPDDVAVSGYDEIEDSCPR